MDNKVASRKKLNVPVLLTLHVRSAHLQNQLRILKESGITRLYISIDGPRNEADRRHQEQLHTIISNFKEQFDEFHVRESELNQGIAVAMITAIDWFFSENQAGIVFEDDIEFTSDTLRFLTQALLTTANNSEILLVSGFQPFSSGTNDYRVCFTNYPQIWGWATHAYKWEQMRSYIFNEPQTSESIKKQIMNFWSVGWSRVHKGYLDTWDLPIATGMLFTRKLCMLPPINLTSNIGVDTHSTNTKEASFPMGLPIERIQHSIEFEIEPVLAEVMELNRRFEKEMYFISAKHRIIPILRKIDRFKFSRSKKDPIKLRMKSDYRTKIKIYE